MRSMILITGVPAKVMKVLASCVDGRKDGVGFNECSLIVATLRASILRSLTPSTNGI